MIRTGVSRMAHDRPPRDWARLAPLVLATAASQALLVVLTPTIVLIADDLGASPGLVGQARAVTAGVAIVAALPLTTRADAIGVRRLIRLGAVLAVAGCAAVAASRTLAVFLAAHALVGLGFACLLSAGFTGVAAFPAGRRGWAVGYVAAANAAAWIVVNPIAGVLAGALSWRVVEAVPAATAVAALLTARLATEVSGTPSTLPVRTLLAEVSARRWIGSELTAYGAWTAYLTYSGAFFVQVHDVSEQTVGWLLAAAPVGYLLAATRSGRLVARSSRRRLVAWTALLMAALLPLLLVGTGTVATATAISAMIGVAAGLRTPSSSGLGLAQLPGHPGAMMAARTAATQLGYLVGAVVGGALIIAGGYAALGIVLAAGMAASALLILRVRDPQDGVAATPAPRREASTAAATARGRDR